MTLTSNERRKSMRLLIIILTTAVLGGCDQPKNQYVEPPPPKVTVAQPLQQEVIEYLEFTGNTSAVESVDVRARVQGFLESMHFESGDAVEQGDPLFVIDPKSFEARLASAKANLAGAEARLMGAKSDYQRKQLAGQRGAVTEAEVVSALAERNAAQATIDATKAEITQAELDLSYTQVTAPISGRISRNLVDVGNLVGSSEATLLTTIRKFDPIFAYFKLNERDLLRIMGKRNKEVEKAGGEYRGVIPLFLGLADDVGYPHEGKLDFVETGVDSSTGTIQLRGVFPNSRRPPEILPGLFARIRLPIDRQENALLVSERALGSDQSGDYLLVVNSENVVEKRPIRKGQQINSMRVIDEGIRADDRVVVSGVLRARPGAKVDPEQSDMADLMVSVDAADQEGGDSKEAGKADATDQQGDDGGGTGETDTTQQQQNTDESADADKSEPSADTGDGAAATETAQVTETASSDTAVSSTVDKTMDAEPNATGAETTTAESAVTESAATDEVDEQATTVTTAAPKQGTETPAIKSRVATTSTDTVASQVASADTMKQTSTDSTQASVVLEPLAEEPSDGAGKLAASRSLVDKILTEGRFVAAVQRDFKPFSFAGKAGERVGFDVDLMHEFARRWLDDKDAVVFLPVFSDGRIPALLEGKVAIVAAALTNTPARQAEIDFSLTYFQDGQRLLVQEQSDIRDVCDLANKKIAVTKASTANENIQKQAEECGIAVEIIPYDSPASALLALETGTAVAYATDGIALEHFAEGKPFKVVGNHFSSEPYGLGLPKGDARLKGLVDLSLKAMNDDGTLAAIYHKWFGDGISPYPIAADSAGNDDPELLQLAAAESPSNLPAAPAQAATPKTYAVQPGDTLSRIAGKVYGDVSPDGWKRIYAANKAAIGTNPANVRVGMELTIPE